jgi:hypothetical protein
MKSTAKLADYRDSLIQEVKEHKLVPLLGAGISYPPPSNIPLWDGFADALVQMMDQIRTRFPSPEMDAVIDNPFLDHARTELRGKNLLIALRALKSRANDLSKIPDQEAWREFNNKLLEFYRDRSPNDYHRSIAATEFPCILTTNYDRLIEAAQEGQANRYPSVDIWEPDKWAVLKYQKKPVIAHIHGWCGTNLKNGSFLERIILTSEDYHNILIGTHDFFERLLMSEFTSHSVLFAGYGGTDPHLELIAQSVARSLGRLGSRDGPHRYVIAHSQQVGAIHDEYRSTLGMRILTIDDYSELRQLFADFSTACPKAAVR